MQGFFCFTQFKKNPIAQNITYPVMEAFYTLQGEGYHQGVATYFLRLAGCNVGCHWCDVKESWDEALHPKLTLEEIISPIKKIPSSIVVVTGGEPLQHDLTKLTQYLHQHNLKTHIETSGAYIPTGQWDWFCLSPKKFKEPTPESISLADELKIIVYNKSDFAFAEKYALLVKPTCKLYLQPEWDKSSQILPEIIEYIKETPKWNISLQIHKYMNIP